MTLEDIKYLLIYTRSVFGVKAEVPKTTEKEFDPDVLRALLLNHRRWFRILNVFIVADLVAFTGATLFGLIFNWS